MARLVEHAPAKVNLTLAVLGRRADGYHLLDSLVVFADVGDSLTLTPGGPLTLNVRGVTAKAAGPIESNLVFKAAKALATEIPDLKFGRFTLDKRLPVAAGLGGGSSDAAAALRLLVRANRLKLNDKRLLKVALAKLAQQGAQLDDLALRIARRETDPYSVADEAARL